MLMAGSVCTMSAQSINVVGKVTDPQGAPLPGVIVTSDKDVALALSNEAGEFTLKSAVDNKKLKFRLLGYKNVEVQPEEAMKVEMETDISNVGEIIDLGYAEKSRDVFSGASSTLAGD